MEEAKKSVSVELSLMERSLQGPFVAGIQLTAADFALYPHVALLARIDQRRPETQALALAPESIRDWMKRVESAPYFAKTYPPHWKE